jgi:hypothetical protein
MESARQTIVIGDSHSRSFVESDYFLTIFIGVGKYNNFTNQHFAQSTRRKLLSIMSHFSKDDYFMIVLGEPDCRWNTYNHWYPSHSAQNPNNKIIDSVSRFKRSILDIRKLYHNLIIYSANPHKRSEQNKTTLMWNKEIDIFCKDHDILFCDIYDEVLSDLNSFLVQSIAGEKEDNIHLNKSVQQLVIQKLNITKKAKKITNLGSSFAFNDKFKCYDFIQN